MRIFFHLQLVSTTNTFILIDAGITICSKKQCYVDYLELLSPTFFYDQTDKNKGNLILQNFNIPPSRF